MLQDIQKNSQQWLFFHSGPRSEDMAEKLYLHENSRTFQAFENMQFIAASLLANTIKGLVF